MCIAESSQSIIPHSQEQGLRPTEVHPGIGDMVEIHMRKVRDSRLVTAIGRVTQVDLDHPNRIKRNNCRKNFRKVLKIITCHSTSMISNDTQSHNNYLSHNSKLFSLSQYYDCFSCVLLWRRLKIFFNLPII
jgi:hypothetical protein